MPAPVTATTAALPRGRSGERSYPGTLRGGDRIYDAAGRSRPSRIPAGGAPVS